jgi:septum site-determining protein MinD
MILTVCGGKGGVGKSTVALNLGAALDAVVVDADLTMADLPVARGPDLHDVLAGRAASVEAVREGGAVDILPCGRSLVGARAARPAAIVEVLADVASAYGDVVVDSPGGLGADAGLPLAAADACLPVTTPTRPAVADSLRTRALAREFETGVARVVLNRANSVPADVERAFGAPAVAVPESERVAATTDRGRPVTVTAPASPAAARFRELADGVQSCSSR